MKIYSPYYIDVIILSNASNEYLLNVTQTAINSLMDSEDRSIIIFKTIVIESNSSICPYQYNGAETVYPNQKFGFNKFLNIGINLTKSKYICLCNNDLSFTEGWATEILNAFNRDELLFSASPICSIHHPKLNINPNSGNYYGYTVMREIAGWCIFLKREVFKLIGPLDDNFKFWYADNDYALTLQKYTLKHALITSSIVDHFSSQTLNSKNEIDQLKLTHKESFYFDYKWGRISFFKYIYKKYIFSFRLKLYSLIVSLANKMN